MDIVVIAFLCLSILFYVIFGGADFGAGIIELFTSAPNRRRTRKTLYHAIGPIWEANHMWLIIAIVIMFVGFPYIYTEMSVYLHIPLAIMLFGIIARGTAFIFRHYDAIQDETHRIYNRVFIASSFITPMFLGIIAGSAVSGKIDHQGKNFMEVYVAGWANWFSLSVGLFTVAICGFLAAVYLIGEADDENDRQRFIRKARLMTIASFCCGGLVFIAAIIDQVPLLEWIFGNAVGIAAVILATASLWALWYYIGLRNIWIPRILAGFQVAMILIALTYAHFPYFLILKHNNALSLFEHQAPSSTMQALGIALLAGSVFILPALYYLYYSFKKVES